MDRKFTRLLLALSMVGCAGGADAAAPYTISNGELVVDVRTDNGAIDDYYLNGINFFGWGAHVSDWGMQQGTDTSTFLMNNTNGGTDQPVTVEQLSPTAVRVSGTYTRGSANVDFVRTLEIAPSGNVLLFTYTLTNKDAVNPVDIAIFETFDPDQGQGSGCGSYETYMDVVSAPPYTHGDAVDCNNVAFVAGSYESGITVASGSPFKVGDGYSLNDFFAYPYDGDGALLDEGTHFGFRTTLPAGGTATFKAAGAASSAGASAAFAALTTALPAAAVNQEQQTTGLEELNDLLSASPPAQSESGGGGLFNPLLVLAMAGIYLGRRRRDNFSS